MYIFDCNNLACRRGGGILSRHNYSVIENEWITLQDGTRLAARIWTLLGGATLCGGGIAAGLAS